MGYFRGIQKLLFGATCRGDFFYVPFNSDFGVGVRLKKFWSTPLAEHILFSMLPWILTLNLDLSFGLYWHFESHVIFSFFLFFLLFEALNGYFWGPGRIQQIVLKSTHVVEQLSFSIVPLILTFDFDLISGSFSTVLGPNGLFLGPG